MSTKGKVLFRVSIGLNLILITCVLWGFIRINFVKDQIFNTEVQDDLVELEGLIAYQKDNQWSTPSLDTTKMGSVLNGLWLGITMGNQMGTLSKKDKEILQRLYMKLHQFPKDDLYRFTDLTETDKENFEELREVLREVGLGMKISIDENFYEQAEALEGKIESPLRRE
ncbi:hypothetical protein [Cytobacillus praedii]|uniref:Uncharacterized protein n=1 Tax=Cytobacillus praedii TaxID=1742358 RepID=A0A4R1AVX4_9BACI|nr:hypothetical protein [Cytobacillus praedii]TCJ01669.1 hypothetical protein E0Y62_23020 [Cytobacillus praedii]